MSLNINAQIKLEHISENTLIPGKVNNIKIKIKNSSNKNKLIRYVPVMPEKWKILFPINNEILKPKETRFLNIFILVPLKTKAGLYDFRLDTSKDIHLKNLNLKVKNYYEIDIKEIEFEKYIEKNHNIKLLIKNKGNTSRKLKIIRNKKFKLNKKYIYLNPFESKIVKLNCITKSNKEKYYLNIKAIDQQGNILNLIKKKVFILNKSNDCNKYSSNLNIEYDTKNNKVKWKLKSNFSKNSFIEIGDDLFDYLYYNHNKIIKVGTDYISKVSLKDKNSNNICLSYYDDFTNNNYNYFYTDFKNEIGIGKNSDNEELNWETKISKNGLLSYLLKKSFNFNRVNFNIKSYRKNMKDVLIYNCIFNMNEDNKIKTGYSRSNFDDNIINKYFRFIENKSVYNKNIYNYSIFKKNKKESKIISFINKSHNICGNNVFTKFKLKTNNSVNPELSLDLIFKNKNRSISISNKDLLNIKSSLICGYKRYIKYKDINLTYYINNYDKDKITFGGYGDIFLNKYKKIYFSAGFNLNQNNKIKLNDFTVGLKLSFDIKIKDTDKKVVNGHIKGLKKYEGIVLDINGKNVRINKNGRFRTVVNFNNKVNINKIHLGPFTGEYFLKQKLPYTIKDNNKNNIKLNIKKYGNLQVKFKYLRNNDNLINKIVTEKSKDKIIIKLYNDKRSYVKKCNGDKDIVFKKIPPGKYKFKIVYYSLIYRFKVEKRNIVLKPGDNITNINKTIKNKLMIKENIEIIN